MAKLKLNQMTCGIHKLAQIHHGKVEIISNDSMDLN
jgi:hypothetical protein